MPTPLSSNMLALTTCRVGALRVGAFRVGFGPRDTRSAVPGVGAKSLYLWAREYPDAPTVTTVLEPVSWTEMVGCTAVGNRLAKWMCLAPSGCSQDWDAGAISRQQLTSGDGYVEMTVPAGLQDHKLAFGLNHINLGVDQLEIDFCIELNSGLILVQENGTVVAGGAYTAGDVFRIGIESGVVKYRKNGGLVHTSVNTPQYPLFVDSSFLTWGAFLDNIYITTSRVSDSDWTVVRT